MENAQKFALCPWVDGMVCTRLRSPHVFKCADPYLFRLCLLCLLGKIVKTEVTEAKEE